MPTKNRQQLLIIGAIVAVALFAGDKLLFAPLQKAWDARANQIADLRTRIAKGKSALIREPGLRNQWTAWQQKTLTNDFSAAAQRVYSAIDAWAQDTGVVINAITPQWKTDSDDYSTYGCRIDAAGDLRRLSRFLYRAEREPLALKIEAIELAARDKDGQQLSLGLQLSGLVLTPKPK